MNLRELNRPRLLADEEIRSPFHSRILLRLTLRHQLGTDRVLAKEGCAM
jgi:hypothetical protein